MGLQQKTAAGRTVPHITTSEWQRRERGWTVSARGVMVGLVMACVLLLVAGCGGTPLSADVDGHMVMLPRVWRAGEITQVGFTLFAGDELGRGGVRVSLLDAGRSLVKAEGVIAGKGTVALHVPDVPAGEYQVEVMGPGFKESASVQVEPGTLVFLDVDRPVYRPGQTVLMRVFTLDSSLMPASAEVEVEAADPTGIRVFRCTVVPDEFGMASLELPLSEDSNVGVWQFTAVVGESSTQLEVRVDECLPPKFEVEVVPSRSWFTTGEPIQGTVSAVYGYGRAVRGHMEVRAWRYEGVWEEYAIYAGPIDGVGSFSLEPVLEVRDVPPDAESGDVRLDVKVVEDVTGYEQTASQVVTTSPDPLRIKVLTENAAFKPTLPFSFLLVTETPGGEAVQSAVVVETVYYGEDGGRVGMERQQVETKGGSALVHLAPPARAARMEITASTGSVVGRKVLPAAYSPSGSFLHVEQFGSPSLHIGDAAVFNVQTTGDSRTFRYEVVSRDRVVLTDSSSGDVQFRVTPAMAGTCRLLVYQLLPSGEVVADNLPFSVEGEYPQDVTMSLSTEEALPGAAVELRLRTEGEARVALAAVDHSVSVQAGSRLNLRQVLAELERLFRPPQAGLLEVDGVGPLLIPGAQDAFAEAGLLVLSDKDIPRGMTVEQQGTESAGRGGGATAGDGAASGGNAGDVQAGAGSAHTGFIQHCPPETWLWEEVTTGEDGKASLTLEVPDVITTWDVRAVALSTNKGLGVAETSLRAFRTVEMAVDLPYSAVRGEQIPVKVALRNYTDTPQELVVEIEASPWFDLLSQYRQTVLVAANDEAATEFVLRPRVLGTQVVKVTARGGRMADTVNSSIVVAAEGVEREAVANAVVEVGSSLALDLSIPPTGVVSGSGRAYLTLSGGLLAPSIAELERLLQTPSGCGEQSMAAFAPAIFFLHYMEETDQLDPEIQARAERLLLTGYQRQLTFRHADGSFSAFGESDGQGSLFLTAFVLKSFAQVGELAYIDEDVLAQAGEWIARRQQADGSFESVGFVHRPDVLSGVEGRDALTAYVAVALLESGMREAAGKAVAFLESRVDLISDPYSLALVAYALTLGQSKLSATVAQRLLSLAEEDEEGLYWSAVPRQPDGQPAQAQVGAVGPSSLGLEVEATGYAALALHQAGYRAGAAEAVRWLVGRRNSSGGFSTSQDTVVALEALAEVSPRETIGDELTVRVSGVGLAKEIKLAAGSLAAVESVEVAAGSKLTVSAEGEGKAVVQGVVRYNLLAPQEISSAFDMEVHYDSIQVDVNETVRVNTQVAFAPPEPFQGWNAGMVVVEVAVPTGFEVVKESLAELGETPGVSRFDHEGQTVVVYLEDMAPGERVSLPLALRALYPVEAKGVASRAYSYYRPEWRAETLGEGLSVD